MMQSFKPLKRNERRTTAEENRLAQAVERLDREQEGREELAVDMHVKSRRLYARITAKTDVGGRPTYSAYLLSPNESTSVMEADPSNLTFGPNTYPLYELSDNPNVPTGVSVQVWQDFGGAFYLFRSDEILPNDLLDGDRHQDTDATVVEVGMLPVGTTVGEDTKWKGFPPGADHKLLESLASTDAGLNWTDSPQVVNINVTNNAYINNAYINNFYIDGPTTWGNKQRIELVSNVCPNKITEQDFAGSAVLIDDAAWIIVATLDITLAAETDLVVTATIVWDGAGEAISGDTFKATIRVDGVSDIVWINFIVSDAFGISSASMGYLVPGLAAGPHTIELVAAQDDAEGEIYAGPNSNLIIQGSANVIEKKQIDFPNGTEVFSTICYLAPVDCCPELDPDDPGTENPFVFPNPACILWDAIEMFIDGLNFSLTPAENVVLFDPINGSTPTGTVTSSTAIRLTVATVLPSEEGYLSATVYRDGLNSGSPVKVGFVKEDCTPDPDCTDGDAEYYGPLKLTVEGSGGNIDGEFRLEPMGWTTFAAGATTHTYFLWQEDDPGTIDPCGQEGNAVYKAWLHKSITGGIDGPTCYFIGYAGICGFSDSDGTTGTPGVAGDVDSVSPFRASWEYADAGPCVPGDCPGGPISAILEETT